MATNFSHLLQVPIESDKRPPVKPAGTYHATIQGYKFDESKKERTPFVRFTFNNVQPGQDIHPDQLKDKDGEDIDFSRWTPHMDFYLTPAARYRLREFIEGLGIPTSGRGYDEVIPETRNLPVLLTVVQTPSQREGSTDLYNNVAEVKGIRV